MTHQARPDFFFFFLVSVRFLVPQQIAFFPECFMALRAFEFLNLVIELLLVSFEIVRTGKARMTLRTCPNLFLVSVRFLVPQQILFFTERFMALRAFEHFENAYLTQS